VQGYRRWGLNILRAAVVMAAIAGKYHQKPTQKEAVVLLLTIFKERFWTAFGVLSAHWAAAQWF
jgi:Tfp pilus assembly major pilin PilA